MEKEKTGAYQQGREAYRNRTSADYNPYSVLHKEFDLWQEGYFSWSNTDANPR